LRLQQITCKEAEAVEGVITDIQRYSLHDGPGLRTNVFFKGCSLRCAWCANPETQTPHPELAVFSRMCIRCGQFDAHCPDGWFTREDTSWKHEVQADYARRVPLCPAGSVRWIGERRTAGNLMDGCGAMRYSMRVGGMTLTWRAGAQSSSPGTPAAGRGHRDRHQTCGHARRNWRVCCRTDLVLFDVKHGLDGPSRIHGRRQRTDPATCAG
jgi:pyruvate formate lyase activating enzyme